MLFCVFSYSSSAESSQGIGATSGTCGSNLTWALSNDGTLTISGTGTMSNYTFSSGTPWEARKSSIKTVAVGSGVTSVGDYAFSGCANLITVNLPDGLKSVGSTCFSNCDALVSITFPNTVTSIGSGCMYDCDKLRNVTLSDTLLSIGYQAFFDCDLLTAINLPDSVTSIGRDAFFSCNNLQTVKLSSGLASIASSCFQNCMISELTIPEGVTSIGEQAFYSTPLTSIHLPSTLENVLSSAFGYCSSLSDVYFAGTQAQAEAILIGTGNTCLSAATWHFGSSEGSQEEPDHSCGDHLSWSLTDSGILTITGSGAMSDFSDSNCPWASQKAAITTVSIETGVTSIGNNAFNSCENLLVLNIPSTLISIGADAFRACAKLTVVNYAGTSVQKSAITIGANNGNLTEADWYCSDGESQGIGATSGTCGSRLTWALSNDGTLTISGTGTMSSYTSSSGTPWEARKGNIKTVVIGSGVTSVGDYAFNGCVNLIAVNLPDGVKTIGSYVFFDCDSLISISLPDSVTAIGAYCFYSCDNLRNITLSDSLDSIGSNCFYSCRSLSSIDLPDSLTSIGSWCFAYCNLLQSIILPGGMADVSSYCFSSSGLSELTLSEGITNINNNAFSSSSLTSVYFPSTLENVSSNAFANCSSLSDVYFAGTRAQAEAILIGTGNTYLSAANWHFTDNPPQNLTTLTLPSMLTTIESEAFSGIAVHKIIIPDSVEVIESRAFADSLSLQELYFEGSPFSIANDILSGCDNVTISCLQGSSAARWANRYGLNVEYHN